MMLCGDGSYYKNEKGNFQASYAVIPQYELFERESLPQVKPAQ